MISDQDFHISHHDKQIGHKTAGCAFPDSGVWAAQYWVLGSHSTFI